MLHLSFDTSSDYRTLHSHGNHSVCVCVRVWMLLQWQQWCSGKHRPRKESNAALIMSLYGKAIFFMCFWRGSFTLLNTARNTAWHIWFCTTLRVLNLTPADTPRKQERRARGKASTCGELGEGVGGGVWWWWGGNTADEMGLCPNTAKSHGSGIY